MRLSAIAVGVGADTGPFSGTVHSVFDNACNIALPADRLLALVALGSGAVPWGYQVATPPGFSFLDHLRGGRAAACRGGNLRFGGTSLVIDLRTARCWRSGLAGLALDLGRSDVRRAWAGAWRRVAERHMQTAGLPPGAAKPILALARATRRLNREDAIAAADTLIGLGAGLTPAGDDFLVGYLAGLWCSAGADAARRSFLAELGAAVAAAGRTNAISRSYLRAASAGEVSESLARAAERIAHGAAPAAVDAAVGAALAVGASSGADGMLGFLIAARAGRAIRRGQSHPPAEPYPGCSLPPHSTMRQIAPRSA
jgi:hypothetical protein